MKKRILSRLNKLANWQVFVLFSVIGLLTYFDGLKNQFLGDDNGQILSNIPVHSLANIRVFFSGGTFYNGQGLHALSGVYYRPLQTTAYSLIYTVFGPNPLFFHLLQLLLVISSSFLLFLIFKFSFRPLLALFLALIFLVHPVNGQTAFAIANMQDALYFFFGILALWILFTYKSKRSTLAATGLLLAALFAKETAALFIPLAALYLYWHKRKQLKLFISLLVPVLALYIWLRVHAIGWLSNPNNVPIDRLSLAARLLTSPSIGLFYILKFLFPWRLSSAYYWVIPSFSIYRVLLPLLADLCVITLVVYTALYIRKRASRAHYFAFIYFAIWSALGYCLVLQILPIDFTAADPWIYFATAGFLGMFGVVYTVIKPRLHLTPKLIFGLAIILIILLGTRTAILGRAWASPYRLAENDLSATNNDFAADYQLSVYYFNRQNYPATKTYAQRSVAIFPFATNLDALGVSQMELGDYAAAQHSYDKAITYFSDCNTYDNLSVLTSYIGSPSANFRTLTNAVEHCPDDAQPWMYLAILDYQQHNIGTAQYAITQAYQYGSGSIQGLGTIYQQIMSGEPLNFTQ